MHIPLRNVRVNILPTFSLIIGMVVRAILVPQIFMLSNLKTDNVELSYQYILQIYLNTKFLYIMSVVQITRDTEKINCVKAGCAYIVESKPNRH